jgi:hypothetical protein
LLDRTLVLAGSLITAIVMTVGALGQTPEVTVVSPEDITIIPPSTELTEQHRLEIIATTTTVVNEEAEEMEAQSLSKRIPSDKTKRCPKWEAKFRQYELPVKAFSYIAWRESRCNPKAHNKTLNRDGSQDLGLVQVNNSWVTVTQQVCGGKRGDMSVLFNVDCNLSVAKYLFENGGLGHWSL